jgi:hypothetical protein
MVKFGLTLDKISKLWYSGGEVRTDVLGDGWMGIRESGIWELGPIP